MRTYNFRVFSNHFFRHTIREMNPMTTDNTLCPLHKFNVRFISQSLWFKVATNTTLLLVTNADVFIQYITVIKVNNFGVFFWRPRLLLIIELFLIRFTIFCLASIWFVLLFSSFLTAAQALSKAWWSYCWYVPLWMEKIWKIIRNCLRMLKMGI